MPTWSEILTELKVESAQGNSAPFDFIRRKYLSELSKYTNRNTSNPQLSSSASFLRLNVLSSLN